MTKTAILDTMQILSLGKAYLWAENDYGNLLAPISKETDPIDVERACMGFNRKAPATKFVFFDGEKLNEIVDVQEATWVATLHIGELRARASEKSTAE